MYTVPKFKVGDEVVTTKRYTGKPATGKIIKLKDYKYLGLVATIKTATGKEDICVVCLDYIKERRALEEL